MSECGGCSYTLCVFTGWMEVNFSLTQCLDLKNEEHDIQISKEMELSNMTQCKPD